jgi:hypothetical protein
MITQSESLLIRHCNRAIQNNYLYVPKILKLSNKHNFLLHHIYRFESPDSSIKLRIMNSSSGEMPFDSLLLYLEETFLCLQLLALGSRLPLVS